MKYNYQSIYEKNTLFLDVRPLLKKAVIYCNKVFTGVYFVAYASLLLYAIIKKYGAVDFMPILFAPLLCLLIVSVLRLAVDRPRPYTENGANITPLSKKKGNENKSFPSRHLACALVIAMTVFSCIPPLGIFLFAISALFFYVRFAVGLHYPSDLAVGALIGILCGIFAFIL